MNVNIHLPLIEEGGWADVQIIVLDRWGDDLKRYEELVHQGYKMFFWLPEYNQYNTGEFLGIRYWMGLPRSSNQGDKMKTEQEIQKHLKRFLAGEIDVKDPGSFDGFNVGYYEALEWVLEGVQGSNQKVRK